MNRAFSVVSAKALEEAAVKISAPPATARLTLIFISDLLVAFAFVRNLNRLWIDACTQARSTPRVDSNPLIEGCMLVNTSRQSRA